jgi:predicted carbohydrate-binding protein with CBM5 and CBM33 domain
MKIIYCIVAREDSKGVFYTIDSVTKGGAGGSTPFDQKPSTEEIEEHLCSIYPEMTKSVWHINTGQSADEIAALYF